jgi:hypothetical protein
MFNRLNEYLENNNIICPEQKGFRKSMRTSDPENDTFLYTLSSTLNKLPLILY